MPHEQQVMPADEAARDRNVVVFGPADEQTRLIEGEFLDGLALPGDEQFGWLRRGADRVFEFGNRLLVPIGMRQGRTFDRGYRDRQRVRTRQRQQRDPVKHAGPAAGRVPQLDANRIREHVLWNLAARLAELLTQVILGVVTGHRPHLEIHRHPTGNRRHGRRLDDRIQRPIADEHDFQCTDRPVVLRALEFGQAAERA